MGEKRNNNECEQRYLLENIFTKIYGKTRQTRMRHILPEFFATQRALNETPDSCINPVTFNISANIARTHSSPFNNLSIAF